MYGVWMGLDEQHAVDVRELMDSVALGIPKTMNDL